MKILSENGFGLASALASSAIVGVLMLAVASSSSLSIKSMRSVEMKGELEDIRNLVREGLDCSQTIKTQQAVCDSPGGGYVDVLDKNGEAIQAVGYSKYSVLSHCGKNGNSYVLNVKYNREAKDPLTGRKITEADSSKWPHLFGDIPRICLVSELDGELPSIHFLDDEDGNNDGIMEFAEGDEDITIKLALTAPTSLTVTAIIAMSGTATYGDDYVLAEPSLLIADNKIEINIENETTAEFTFTVKDDYIVEDEDIVFTIETATNADITRWSELTINIVDDPVPIVNFSDDQTVQENVGTVTVTAYLSEAITEDVTVPFIVSGTATNPEHHNLTDNDITILKGETAGSITFNVVPDSIDDKDKTVTLTMDEPIDKATRGPKDNHTVTIEKTPINIRFLKGYEWYNKCKDYADIENLNTGEKLRIGGSRNTSADWGWVYSNCNTGCKSWATCLASGCTVDTMAVGFFEPKPACNVIRVTLATVVPNGWGCVNLSSADGNLNGPRRSKMSYRGSGEFEFTLNNNYDATPTDLVFRMYVDPNEIYYTIENSGLDGSCTP